MNRVARAPSLPSRIPGSDSHEPRPTERVISAVAAAALLLLGLGGCARTGRLDNVGHTVSPAPADSTVSGARARPSPRIPLAPLFGGQLIALEPGTADSTIRFLGRLRAGYTADTLNVFLCGDNRPGFRLARLKPQLMTIREGFSLNPIKILRGLINIPYAIGKGIYPDFALFLEMPALLGNMPKWGREREVMKAMMSQIDSLHARGQDVAAVINAGDLVKDGRYPAHWERFLRLTHPLTSKVPYFPIAGNHERTDTEDGVENWRTATGLPIGGDRLYYCFDSADGWVRFIALDSNPIVNAGGHWTREVQIQNSDEQFTWMVERVKEHRGPVLVLLHHPPFTAGAHRPEWQSDPLLIEQRERMVKALHESGIAVLVSGHDHSYQRALLTWPDAVLIALVTGGAGSPLHYIPPPGESAALFSEYNVAGSIVQPQNVFTSSVFNFTHLRLWFGGGDFHTYAVDENSGMKLIDEVQIDLKRYGIPEIDQHKVPIAPEKGPKEPSEDIAKVKDPSKAAADDSTQASDRLLEKSPPSGVKTPKRSDNEMPDSASVAPRAS